MKVLFVVQILTVGLLAVSSSAQSPGDMSLRQLYEGHYWFELREYVQGNDAPALYRGAVASAFNRVDEAERYLTQVIREASDAATAVEGRDLLGTLYLRTGRASDALRVIEELIALAPQRSDLRNVRTMLAALRPTPNQRVQSATRATFDCAVSAAGVRMPLSINGRTVSWLLDTGFTMPALSEQEAQMLGLVVRDETGRAVDGSGGSTTFRVTQAERVTIGGTELSSVLMLVFPDSQPPWNALQPGNRGIIGLPVALALERIRWTSRGTCETGALDRPAPGASGNLAFNGLEPVARVEFDKRMLDFVLDTGNQTTSQLWERFGVDFAELMSAQGTRSSVRVNQIGGSNAREVVVLPEARLRIGGLDTVLKPANIFSRPVGDDRLHGNVGMDLLSQAAEVTVDFQAMELMLR